jgi:hypothetical protein
MGNSAQFYTVTKFKTAIVRVPIRPGKYSISTSNPDTVDTYLEFRGELQYSRDVILAPEDDMQAMMRRAYARGDRTYKLCPDGTFSMFGVCAD